MTEAQFLLLVTLSLSGILLNAGFAFRLSVEIDRLGDRLAARIDEIAARVERMRLP